MADSEPRQPAETPPARTEDEHHAERERTRFPNHSEPAGERENASTPHPRGNDRPAESRDVDPDSAESDVNRDDTMTES
jgi:hypothetical protein